MRLPFRRRLCAAFALSALAAGGAATAGGGDDLVACRSKGQVQSRKDGWIRINAFRPDRNEGPQRIDDFATTPAAPNRVYTTNGVVVKLSADGGCTWNLVTSGAQEVPGGQHQADVFTALAAPSDDRLWAAAYDDVAGVPRPRIHLYDNLRPGASGPPVHHQPENGLPAVGKPIDFLSSPWDPSECYLLLEQPADPQHGRTAPTRLLYATYVPEPAQAGAALGPTWRQVPTPAELGSIEGIALGAPGALWIWSGARATVSADANADNPNWAPATPANGPITALDANIQGEALVASAGAQGSALGRRVDAAGRVLGPGAALPVLATAIAHGQLRPETRVLSGERGTFGYDAALRRWVDITPKGAGALHGLTMANGRASRLVLGHTKDALYRFDTYAGESFVRTPTHYTPIDLDLPFAKWKAPHFEVPTATVTVRPGAITNAANELRIPATINLLDVFFLVDTTGSMQPTIDGLRNDVYLIADQLRKKVGQSACFGVGDFKDVSTTDPIDVFHTHMKVECEPDPAMPKMKAALAKLHSAGGGADPAEAQTIALKQMMTGAGSTNPFVLPDQDAEFRPDAYKVVVLITDAPFKRGSGYPVIEDVASTMKASEVRVVNVLVRTNLNPLDAYRDMAQLARETDSLAPAGGVDCDRDGRIGPGDPREGDPIVCQSDGSNPTIGPLIVSLLLGVEDPGTVEVGIADPGRVVRAPIKGTTSAIANLKRDVTMPFTLPVGCRADQDGQDLTVDLSATVRALPVDAHARLVVRCRSVPPVQPVVVVRPPSPPEPPEALGRPAPRPPLAVAAMPVVNPPGPVSNMNLNAGFSQQEEEQFQLAAVTQGASDEQQDGEEIELAMTGLDPSADRAPAVAFLAGAAAITAAAAVAHRRRLQRSVRTAPAR